MVEKDYKPYVMALREQVEEHIHALDSLAKFLEDGALSFIQRNSAERSLQVLVEAAIGCSKHLLKKVGKPVPAEARVAIERVCELLKVSSGMQATMRGAVGMRNAITHDYLNVDWAKIEPVMRGGHYRSLKQYVIEVTDVLRS